LVSHDYSTSATGIVPLDQRRPRWHFTALWMTFVAGFSFMVPGFQMHDGGYNLLATAEISALGYGIYVAYALVAAYLGATTGQTFGLLTRRVFGRVGSGLISVTVAIAALGWVGFQAGVLAQLWDGFYGWHHLEVTTVTAAAVMIANNLFGFTGISAFARYLVTPLVLLWCTYLVLKAVLADAGRLQHNDATGHLPWWVAVAAVIGFAMWGNEPDVWRYGTPRALWPLPTYLLAGSLFVMFCVAGWMMARLAGEGNRFAFTVDYSLFGAFWLAFIVATISQIAINDGNYYEAVNAAQNLIGGWACWPRYYTCLLLAAGGALAGWIVNYRIPNAWFAVPILLAITAPSATTIMAVDQLLVPRLFGCPRSLTHVPAWRDTPLANWPAIVAMLVAIAYGATASAILPGHAIYDSPRNWGPVPLETWLLAGAIYLASVAARPGWRPHPHGGGKDVQIDGRAYQSEVSIMLSTSVPGRRQQSTALSGGAAAEGGDIVGLDEWFLTAEERGNASTRLDSRHPEGVAWTTGNLVRPLVHGAVYFAELLAAVTAMRRGDHLFFTDWRGDADERLGAPGTEVSHVLAAAAARGVVVRGLIWRSHLDRFHYQQSENRHLGREIQAAGGECLLDMRVRAGGSHHQKLVVLRHQDHPEDDVAYLGGIDLCHGRKDDSRHLGDEQPCPLGAVYGSRPAWHDVQVAIQGPAVGDVETAFRERWEDPTPLTRNPYHRWRDRVLRPNGPAPCPPPYPDPPRCGTHAVQVLRTYPCRRRGYDFAPSGERSIARAYQKALRQAQQLVYLEDQYLWSPHVVGVFADALSANPGLRLIAVVPLFPDRDSRTYNAPQLLARARSLQLLRDHGGDRVAVYGIENALGTPVYVHAKVCIVDDTWLTIGSDNINLRSWSYDSELSCAVLDQSPAGTQLAQRLRLALAREHLDRAEGDDADLLEPIDAFAAFAQSAKELDHWHAAGGSRPRPPGRLRPYRASTLPASTVRWAHPSYRLMYDPDGRPRALRHAGGF
jgi:phosphatidylserine/phosphatidylglycerophosphate/cardiolipin synthase-like enzyme/purine-cytosine permease-like protein